MLCVIWYHLCNLKNVKNIHGAVLLLVKLEAEAQNTDDPQNIIFVNNVSPARAVVNWN